MILRAAVIDAQVVNGLSAEVAGKHHNLSGPPVDLFERLITTGIPVCMDDRHLLYSEWSASCDPDWLENWYLEFVSAANVIEMAPARLPAIAKKLSTDFGFPRSRDRTVVLTSMAAAGHYGATALVSEDLDFYEPRDKGKGAAIRNKYLRGDSQGSVKRYLRREHDVHICSVLVFDSCDVSQD